VRELHITDPASARPKAGGPLAGVRLGPVSRLHLRHIETALVTKFTGFVELADFQTAKPDMLRVAFLSRALAAYPVAEIIGDARREVALGITDGTDDNGIDLIHDDTSQERQNLVQSKWDSSGSDGPQVGDVQKFIQGF